MKRFRLAVRILLTITVLVVLVLAYIYMPKQTCERITAIPHTNNECVMLSQTGVEKILSDAQIEVLGRQQKEVDLGAISEAVRQNPFVKEVNFVHFAGKKLIIDYTLRNIRLNVFTQDGSNYLVDNDGVVVPVTDKMTDFVLVANGNIKNDFKYGKKAPESVFEALKVARAIEKDDFYKALFRQIFINGKNEPELISAIGGQSVLLGSADNIDEKLDNLRTVYENGLPHKGYKTYCQLDARYKNRIIASKHN